MKKMHWCKLQAPKRVNYFAGQLLTEKDFQAEQIYIAGKRRLLNRYLHGWGIVSGLKVSLSDNEIEIEPGLALDCHGNEIVVPKVVKMSLPDSEHSNFVVIEYAERPIEFIPKYDPHEISSDQEDKRNPTRIEEIYSIRYLMDDPCLNHGKAGSKESLCEDAHAIPLAKLVCRRTKWSVNQLSRRNPGWWSRLMSAILGSARV
jgi:hypothetical protein